METLVQFSPVIIIVVLFLIQNRMVTTPADLEKKHRQIVDEINPEKRHREILEDVDKKYATKSVVSELQTQIHSMADKVDKIYNFLLENKQ